MSLASVDEWLEFTNFAKKKLSLNHNYREIMKKISIVLAALILGSFVFNSCKGDESSGELTTQKKLQHRWGLVDIRDINYVGSTTTVDYIDTVVHGPGNFLEFSTNANAYITIDGQSDTVKYRIVNDQTLEFDGDVFTIDVLTSSSCIFTFKEREEPPFYDNIITLKR
jgi:hypothetical protein